MPGTSSTLRFVDEFIKERTDLWNFSESQREKSTSVGMIAWLLNTLVRNSNDDLKPKDLTLAIHSLIQMEQRYTVDFTWLNGEPLNDIMNSTRGKIYDALINCSIKEVRINQNRAFWDNEIEKLFTERLLSKTASTEFYWSVGFNIPQISYLNMSWLSAHKSALMSYETDEFEQPVFYGYLLFSAQLYTNLFDFFYDEYLQQVPVLTDTSNISRRFVEHVWVAYAIDLPRAERLIDYLIASENPQQLLFLVDRIKIEQTATNTQRIRRIWKSILSIAERSDDRDLQNKLFELIYFVEILSDFSESDLDLFERTIALGGININSYRLLKMVEGKINAQEFSVGGRLLNILLDNISSEAYFDEEKIIEMVETLYQHKELTLADQISIKAVERKNFRLVKVYNKYHLN